MSDTPVRPCGENSKAGSTEFVIGRETMPALLPGNMRGVKACLKSHKQKMTEEEFHCDHVIESGLVTTSWFYTVPDADYLSVAGTLFHGTQGPTSFEVQNGTQIDWTTSSNIGTSWNPRYHCSLVGAQGCSWRLCWAGKRATLATLALSRNSIAGEVSGFVAELKTSVLDQTQYS